MSPIRPNLSESALRPVAQGGKRLRDLVAALENAKDLAKETGRPLDTEFAKKVRAVIASRIQPRSHPPLSASTPTSRVMQLVARFEKIKEKHGDKINGWRAEDAQYLARARALLKKRRKEGASASASTSALKIWVASPTHRPQHRHEDAAEAAMMATT